MHVRMADGYKHYALGLDVLQKKKPLHAAEDHFRWAESSFANVSHLGRRGKEVPKNICAEAAARAHMSRGYTWLTRSDIALGKQEFGTQAACREEAVKYWARAAQVRHAPPELCDAARALIDQTNAQVRPAAAAVGVAGIAPPPGTDAHHGPEETAASPDGPPHVPDAEVQRGLTALTQGDHLYVVANFRDAVQHYHCAHETFEAIAAAQHLPLPQRTEAQGYTSLALACREHALGIYNLTEGRWANALVHFHTAHFACKNVIETPDIPPAVHCRAADQQREANCLWSVARHLRRQAERPRAASGPEYSTTDQLQTDLSTTGPLHDTEHHAKRRRLVPPAPGSAPRPLPPLSDALRQCGVPAAPQADPTEIGALDALYEAGAAVDVKDAEGNTALHRAAAADNEVEVRDLLAADADVDVQNQRGETPLHIAAAKGMHDVVVLLLSCEPDLGAKNQAGLTALDIATACGHSEVIRSLQEAQQKLAVPPSPPRAATPLPAAPGAKR